MKNGFVKSLVLFLAVLCLSVFSTASSAYTILDSPTDSIHGSGDYRFESYGINVTNFTPGVNSGGIIFDLFTNYPQAGATVGSWNTQPADLFITETYHGASGTGPEQILNWAIPLVTQTNTHTGVTFTAGTIYRNDAAWASDYFKPSGIFIYGYGVPVQIYSGNAPTGASGTVSWESGWAYGALYDIRIVTNLYEDDPNATLSLMWGTATCANDVVSGNVPNPSAPVPEPGTMILLGSGLVGLSTMVKKRRANRMK